MSDSPTNDIQFEKQTLSIIVDIWSLLVDQCSVHPGVVTEGVCVVIEQVNLAQGLRFIFSFWNESYALCKSVRRFGNGRAQ